jgi:geranylgeranyl pyrophosphate synthase
MDSIQAIAHERTSAELERAFQAAMALPPHLDQRFEAALRHVLHHPGSMVRPRTVYQLARAFGLLAHSAMDLAVALEYFHTASLVFDDLPSMDNASSRRGAPCVHVAFGESGAILAALALINRAYALTWKAISSAPAGLQAQAMHYLEERLGLHGVLNGQSLDLNYSQLPHNAQTTERIACGKTVSLIRLTLVFPAILGGATANELQLLEHVAHCWGLSYQMVDDLKDVLQSSGETGKTSARDEHLDRPNSALVLGVPAAVERLTHLIDEGDRTLRRLLVDRPSLEFLRRLRASLQHELSRVTERLCETAYGEHG